MFPFTLDIYCTSVRPGRGIPHMWLSLRFLLSFYLLKGFFSSFSLLLLRVKGRGCHTLLKPYETNCGLWIWAIQIKFDWLIDWWYLTSLLSPPFLPLQISLLSTQPVEACLSSPVLGWCPAGGGTGFPSKMTFTLPIILLSSTTSTAQSLQPFSDMTCGWNPENWLQSLPRVCLSHRHNPAGGSLHRHI